MKEQLLEAWRTANRVHLLLVSHLTEDAMKASLSTRGRTVFQQMAHVHAVRLQWLEVADKKIFATCTAVDKEAAPDKVLLTGAFESSGRAIETLLDASWEQGGRIRGFKKGLLPFSAYLIAHEAHHRGHILLTLKQSGIKLPEDLKWGLWEWDKI